MELKSVQILQALNTIFQFISSILLRFPYVSLVTGPKKTTTKCFTQITKHVHMNNSAKLFEILSNCYGDKMSQLNFWALSNGVVSPKIVNILNFFLENSSNHSPTSSYNQKWHYSMHI